ncbi:MAG: DUF4364 family protein [Peptostreptococcaceae bacterium]|nr:DUF4364 family protein [Peptostreptococcaceae bacterium]
MLGKSVDVAKSKLNILFLLNKVGDPVEEYGIAHAMIENDLMEYFSYKQYIAELESANFIAQQNILGKTYYGITKRGKITLEYFSNKMMGSEKKLIDRYVEENIQSLTRYKEIYTDYKKRADSKYQVDVRLMDRETPFFSLTMEVPTKKMSEEIIEHWNQKPLDMYIRIMNMMISNKKEED